MRRVCVVITARPSYSRIKTVLDALRARGNTPWVIAAGSALLTRYGRIVEQIREDGHFVAAEVPSTLDGSGNCESAISTGLLTSQLASLFANMKPDVVVTIADRHETLATAIAASYQNIPLCHIQGGEITGSIDDKVRNAITQLADIHCVSTAAARDRVLSMRPGARVYWTGCPSIDLAAEALRLGPLPGADVVVLQHPVTTEVDQAADQMRATVEALRGMNVMWFWPGEDAGSEAMCKVLRLEGIKPIRNKPPVEFLRILLGSKVLVGNSSVGIRECSFLGVPVIDVGSRQWGREVGPNVARAWPHLARYLEHISRPPRSSLYGDGKAGERIAAILAGEEASEVAA